MNLLVMSIGAFYWFDQDPLVGYGNSKILLKKRLRDALGNIEIVGAANVISLPLSEVLFAVNFHLDFGQGSRKGRCDDRIHSETCLC